MKNLHLWQMMAVLMAGLFLLSIALFGMLAQQYGFMRDMAIRQQTGIISGQADAIQKQAQTIRDLRKLLFGDNGTEARQFPPGEPT